MAYALRNSKSAALPTASLFIPRARFPVASSIGRARAARVWRGYVRPLAHYLTLLAIARQIGAFNRHTARHRTDDASRRPYRAAVSATHPVKTAAACDGDRIASLTHRFLSAPAACGRRRSTHLAANHIFSRCRYAAPRTVSANTHRAVCVLRLVGYLVARSARSRALPALGQL